jgi:uncharacterized membrane protein
MKQFLKTTIMGGLLFLLPLALVLIVLNQVFEWGSRLIKPVLHALGIDHLETIRAIGGIATVTAVVLVLVAFLAGLAARTGLGRWLSKRAEAALMRAPQYRMAKSMAQGFTEVDDAGTMEPVLVAADEGWQLGYLVEELADGWVTVFVPQAPTPMSGNIVYLPAGMIRHTGMTMLETNQIIMGMGTGSAAALRGTRLGAPVTGSRASR